MSRNSEIIVLEDENGKSPRICWKKTTPYDLQAPVITLKPEDYGTWYIDCMDIMNSMRKDSGIYRNGVKSENFHKNYFVPGRDLLPKRMTFLGFICKAREARLLETRQWVHVKQNCQRILAGLRRRRPCALCRSVEPAEEIKTWYSFNTCREIKYGRKPSELFCGIFKFDGNADIGFYEGTVYSVLYSRRVAMMFEN